jgi:hypothetical protein
MARILTFGYDANVTDLGGMVSENRIGDHAWNLLTSLVSYRDRDDTVGASGRVDSVRSTLIRGVE